MCNVNRNLGAPHDLRGPDLSVNILNIPNLSVSLAGDADHTIVVAF